MYDKRQGDQPNEKDILIDDIYVNAAYAYTYSKGLYSHVWHACVGLQ